MNAVARLAAPAPIRVIPPTARPRPRSRSRGRNSSGSTSTPRTRISSRAAVARRKRLPQPFFAVAELFEHLETAHTVRQSVAGQVGDVGVELPQPVPGRVVAHQTRAHHRAVGVDDPAARRRHRAVVGIGVGDLLIPVEQDVARRVTPGSPTAPPTTGTPPAPTRQRCHLDLAGESQPRPAVEIDSGRHFTTRSRPR